MVELADRQVIEVVPVGHAIVSYVETAVAAENHVPAVVRIDPERVLISVDAAASRGTKRLAAVAGAGHRDAQHVKVVRVAGIDADLAEVHRPGVDAVDSRPRIAAVGRLVNAAVLEAFGTLSI